MHTERFRRSASWVGALAGILLVGLLWSPSDGGEVALDLSIGLFGGLSAALAFVLALGLSSAQLWPPARAIVLQSPVVLWLVLNASAIVLGVADGLTQRPSAASQLAAFSIACSTGAAIFGLLGVVRALRAVSGTGRRSLQASVLLAGASRTGRRRHPADLDGVLPAAAQALSAGDVPQFLAYGDGLLEAARRSCADRRRADEAEALARIMLGYQSLMVRVLPRGETVAEVGWMVRSMVDALAHLSGHVKDRTTPAGAVATMRGVRLLAGQMRVLNWIAAASCAHVRLDPSRREDMAIVLRAVGQGHDHLRACADPDPPLHFLPDKHPWGSGITGSPEATMLWFVAVLERGTHLQYASNLYVTHESLLGTKFFGDFHYGEALPALQRGVEEAFAGASTGGVTAGRLQDASFGDLLQATGGGEALWVSLLAIRLAELVPASWSAPFDAPDGVSVAPRSLNERWRFVVPELSPPSAENALDLVARCLSGTAGRGGLDAWRRALLDTQHPMPPPGTALVEVPGYVVLAVACCLRASREGRASLPAFVRALPRPALLSLLGCARLKLDPATTASSVRGCVIDDDGRTTAAHVVAVIEGLIP